MASDFERIFAVLDGVRFVVVGGYGMASGCP
jgi:hypothetical protein